MKIPLALSLALAAATAGADGPSPASSPSAPRRPEPLLTEAEARSVAERLLGPGTTVTSVRRGASPVCAHPALRIENFQVRAESGGKARTVNVQLETQTCTAGDPRPPGAAQREEKIERARKRTGFSGEQVERALEDLARRLGVGRDAIEVTVAQPLQWPDGSLGCPEPGKAYTQAVVEGFVVQLRAGGKLYNYHGSPNRPAFFCERSVLPTGVKPSDE